MPLFHTCLPNITKLCLIFSEAVVHSKLTALLSLRIPFLWLTYFLLISLGSDRYNYATIR